MNGILYSNNSFWPVFNITGQGEFVSAESFKSLSDVLNTTIILSIWFLQLMMHVEIVWPLSRSWISWWIDFSLVVYALSQARVICLTEAWQTPLQALSHRKLASPLLELSSKRYLRSLGFPKTQQQHFHQQ